jgi:predicted SAM-dependent methyltransferase
MNKLEQAIGNLNNIQENIDALIYAIGDSPQKYTEDELLNILMGMSQLHQTWYDKLWVEYENFRREYNAFDEDDIFDQNYLRNKESKTFDEFDEEKFNKNLEKELYKK